MNTPEFLQGDGRQTVQPINALSGTMPIPIQRSAARRMVAVFKATGSSFHSATGSTLWVVLAYCKATDTQFSITHEASSGYFVKKVPL